jgi:hypothetical protein
LQLLHTPPAQVPEAQAWQASPPVPQALAASPGRQVVPSQQPPAQLVASQVARGLRVTVRSTRRRARMTTVCSPLATTWPLASPSTRSVTVDPASESGNRITAVSLPLLLSGRGGSGRLTGAKASLAPASSATRPESESEVSIAAGSY